MAEERKSGLSSGLSRRIIERITETEERITEERTTEERIFETEERIIETGRKSGCSGRSREERRRD